MNTKNAIEAEIAMDAETAKGLVNTGKLDSRQLLRIGYEADDEEVWGALIVGVDFKDFSPDEIEDIGTKAKCSQVWKKIINNNDGKLTTPQLLKMGRLARDTNIWEIIIPKIDLGQFDPEMLLVIGGIEVENWRIWLEIVKVANKVNFTSNQLLTIGSKANCGIVWKAVTKAIGELPK